MGLQARHDALRKRANELGVKWRQAFCSRDAAACAAAIRSSARLHRKRYAVIDKAKRRGVEIQRD